MNSNNLDHLAIIMDGNGRWALERGLDRTAGHAAGEHSLSKTIDWAIQNDIQWLTVYAFSTENWLRSDDEVEYLMFFNRDILLRRRDEFNQKGVRFRFLGDLTDNKIPEENKELMTETENLTQKNTKLNLNFAFNYGSHDEIHNAVLNLHNLNLDKELTINDIKDGFIKYFQYPEIPFPDLLLRTAGETRISNFLLYQIAYAEIMFIDKFWPEFSKKDFKECVSNFQKVSRRFGKRI